jgi:hypothetical protein
MGGLNRGYVELCGRLLEGVVGKRKFAKQWAQKRSVMEIASISDEAMILLLLENNEQKWLAEHDAKGKNKKVTVTVANEEEVGGDARSKKKKDNGVRTKCTQTGKGNKNGMTKRNAGWADEGVQRFNVLFDLVQKDRENNGRWFDEELAIIKTVESGGGDGGFDDDEPRAVKRTKGNNILFYAGGNSAGEAIVEMVSEMV